MSKRAEEAGLRRSVERHYDGLALLYRLFWGEHIHHGLWHDERLRPRVAQVRLTAYLAGKAGVRPGEHVLDVGCGFGASGRWLIDRYGCRVTGLTVSRKQARFVQRVSERQEAEGVMGIVRGDAADLPFGGAAFDVVWAIESLEHLADKRSFVKDAARLLRPGGRFALCSWQRADGTDQDGERVLAEVREAFLCPSLATEGEYRRWCDEAGLKVVLGEDLTANVRATWDTLIRRVGRPWLLPLRAVVGSEVRRFLRGFASIAKAYDTGVMRYGLMVAVKPAGTSLTETGSAPQ